LRNDQKDACIIFGCYGFHFSAETPDAAQPPFPLDSLTQLKVFKVPA
jgi:hypothetical protein